MKIRFISTIFLGLAVTASGCVNTSEPNFSTRNAQVELDLHSLMRSQSNELLAMTQTLEASSKSGFASARKLSRTLEDAVMQMDQIHMNLPSLLAAQDVEIAGLRSQVRKGALDKEALKVRTSAIASYRKSLLGSLDASAVRAAKTYDALASSEHADQAGDLARDLDAARTMIAMQL